VPPFLAPQRPFVLTAGPAGFGGGAGAGAGAGAGPGPGAGALVGPGAGAGFVTTVVGTGATLVVASLLGTTTELTDEDAGAWEDGAAADEDAPPQLPKSGLHPVPQ
jgi:hypothetical protein